MESSAQMVEVSGQAHTLRLLGERLCLDFANTVDPRHSNHPREFLTNYTDLVAWARHAGALAGHEAERLLREAAQRPQEAHAVFMRARDLRQALYRIFSAIARDAAPMAADLELFNQALAEALVQARVIQAGDGFGWSWVEHPDALDRMLWPVVRSAAELLTSGQLNRVRECPGDDGCGWLFFDMSKNGSRRWCSMAGCGNRAKTLRHGVRRRSATITTDAAEPG